MGASKDSELVAEPEKRKSARKRMTIFRAADGQALSKEMMPTLGIDDRAIAAYQAMAAVGGKAGSADKTSVLFAEPGENGMSLIYAWFKSGFILPRHSHNSDCLYYVLSGEIRMGTQVLHRGDGVFIPAEHGYTYEVGPDGVEVLEFRNSTRFNFVLKQNDDAHWNAMVDAYAARGEVWASEVPPSK